MKEEVFKTIESIISEKREAKKYPLIVPFLYLEKAIGRLPLQELRELYTERKVDFGRTINDNYVEIRTSLDKRTREIDLHKINQNDETD